MYLSVLRTPGSSFSGGGGDQMRELKGLSYGRYQGGSSTFQRVAAVDLWCCSGSSGNHPFIICFFLNIIY